MKEGYFEPIFEGQFEDPEGISFDEAGQALWNLNGVYALIKDLDDIKVDMAFKDEVLEALEEYFDTKDLDVLVSMSTGALRLFKALHMSAITEITLRDSMNIPIMVIPSETPKEYRDAMIVLLLMRNMDVLPGY